MSASSRTEAAPAPRASSGEEAPPSAFGGLLRRHRVVAGLSQEMLAERAGLSVRGISDLERGARRAPHRDTVRLLARALDLTAGEIEALLAAAARRRGPAAGAAGSAPP